MTSRSSLCKKCRERCCKHPTFTPPEYIRLVSAIGNEKAQEAKPFYESDVWGFIEECPGKTEQGCILSYPDRPLICRIYPFLPVPTRTMGTLLLLDVNCPQWRVFGTDIEKVKKEFAHD